MGVKTSVPIAAPALPTAAEMPLGGEGSLVDCSACVWFLRVGDGEGGRMGDGDVRRGEGF